MHPRTGYTRHVTRFLLPWPWPWPDFATSTTMCRKILGVVTHIWHSGGTTAAKRHSKSLSDSDTQKCACYNISYWSCIYGNINQFQVFLLPWPWPDDLDVRSGRGSRSRLSKDRASQTDRQTDRQMRLKHYHASSRLVQIMCDCAVKRLSKSAVNCTNAGSTPRTKPGTTAHHKNNLAPQTAHCST